MHYLAKTSRTVVFGLLLLSTGCAMRVTGIVRDGSTGNRIGGAVLTAQDGRNRLSTTDPYGRYAVKTDRQRSNLVVSAPGYATKMVAVSDTQRFPVVNVDLQPTMSAAGVTTVTRVERDIVPADAYTDAQVAAKLQELQGLYNGGLISNDEYRRTRIRILQGL